MKINRHFIKNIVLTISWAVLTFITDSLIINYYCIDNSTIKTGEMANFYELELCVQSKEIILSSIYVYAGLLALIGFYQLAQSIRLKSTNKDMQDAKNLGSAAQALLVISIALFVIIKTGFVG